MVELADTPDLGSGAARREGSSPFARTNKTNEIEVLDSYRTVTAQILTPCEKQKVRFPKNIQFRRNKATIYGKKPNYPFYRISYYVAGKRVFSSFKTYGEAKAEAEKKIREIAGGSQAAALTSEQSRDSLAALQRLESYRQSTGRRVSVLVAVSEYVEAVEKLNGRSLGEAVEGYLQTVVSVKRKDVAEAVEEFATLRQHKAEAKLPCAGWRGCAAWKFYVWIGRMCGVSRDTLPTMTSHSGHSRSV